MYLVNAVINANPHHRLRDSVQEAFKLVAFTIMGWIWRSRCDETTAKQMRALLDQEKYLEAFAAWNRIYPDRAVSIHEIEIMEKNCHHDPDEQAGPGIFCLLEWSLPDWSLSYVLCQTNKKALACAAEMLSSFI
jgi:hypothetical protein